GERCGGLDHLVDEPLRPGAGTSLSLLAHRGVVLPGGAAPDLPTALVRRLDVLLLQPADGVEGAESPLRQLGAPGRDDDDTGRTAFVEELEKWVHERAVVEHQPGLHGHRALELDGP